MKIVRGKKEIELTPEELRQAYDEQNKLFRKEDIKREFASLYLNAEDAMDFDDWASGCDYETFSEVIQEDWMEQIRNDSDSFLEAVFEVLNDDFDANLSENAQIENAIEEIIGRMS